MKQPKNQLRQQLQQCYIDSVPDDLKVRLMYAIQADRVEIHSSVERSQNIWMYWMRVHRGVPMLQSSEWAVADHDVLSGVRSLVRMELVFRLLEISSNPLTHPRKTWYDVWRSSHTSKYFRVKGSPEVDGPAFKAVR